MTLDAGISTGWSYWVDGELRESGVVKATFAEEVTFEPMLEELPPRPDLIVMELTRPYPGKLGRQLAHVQRLLLRRWPTVVTIQPWAWKTTHKKAPLPKHCTTTHERDAIRMGMWVLKHLDRFPNLPTA